MILHIQQHSDIRLQAVVGVFEWERLATRPLVFDLVLESGNPLELGKEDIERQMSAWLECCRYYLLEALAEHLVQCMFSAWQCRRIVLGIEKPGALGDVIRVGVRIERNRP